MDPFRAAWSVELHFVEVPATWTLSEFRGAGAGVHPADCALFLVDVADATSLAFARERSSWLSEVGVRCALVVGMNAKTSSAQPSRRGTMGAGLAADGGLPAGGAFTFGEDECKFELLRQVSLERLETFGRSISAVLPAHFDLSDPACLDLHTAILLDVLAVRLAWTFWGESIQVPEPGKPLLAADKLRASTFLGGTPCSALGAGTQKFGSVGSAALIEASTANLSRAALAKEASAGLRGRLQHADTNLPPRCALVVPARYAAPGSKPEPPSMRGSFGVGSRGLEPFPRWGGAASSGGPGSQGSSTTASSGTGRGGASSSTGSSTVRAATSPNCRTPRAVVPLSRVSLAEGADALAATAETGKSSRAVSSAERLRVARAVGDKRAALARAIGEERTVNSSPRLAWKAPSASACSGQRQDPATPRSKHGLVSSESPRGKALERASPACAGALDVYGGRGLAPELPPLPPQTPTEQPPPPPPSPPPPPREVVVNLAALSATAATSDAAPVRSNAQGDVLFEVELELGSGRMAPIRVRRGDILSAVATDFAHQHGLSEQSMQRIARYLERLSAAVA